ncbi:MAG: gas vesicle protein GvpG [Armatimonadetes bacterium]|nr:gas vesicle protein GvpG [Armatimonadota bacterium]
MFIIDDIIFSPIKLVKWIGEKLMEESERELNDDSKIKAELLDLQIRLELEEISEEEYKTKETELLKKLEEINKNK